MKIKVEQEHFWIFFYVFCLPQNRPYNCDRQFFALLFFAPFSIHVRPVHVWIFVRKFRCGFSWDRRCCQFWNWENQNLKLRLFKQTFSNEFGTDLVRRISSKSFSISPLCSLISPIIRPFRAKFALIFLRLICAWVNCSFNAVHSFISPSVDSRK